MIEQLTVEQLQELIHLKLKTDINEDGVIDTADDVLVDGGDDFGFNEGIEFL